MKNIIFLLISFLSLTVFSCKEKNTNENGDQHLSPDIVDNPATASGVDKNGKEIPVFKFNETNFHFGEIKEGVKVTHEFKFTNVGKADLVINTVTPSCGCTVASFTKERVQPGKQGSVLITFDSSGKSGMQSKTITVLANTIPNTKVLTISAEIISK